ncbi:MAG: tripartite tricarboxylate transporter TctB family protein [Geminicoccaceae bacterium]|nr:MAG: tripartite tricarboxylate transporter TctB family protein [Geminicoccaceae bacterium]
MQSARAKWGDLVVGGVLILVAWYVIDTASTFRGDGWLTPTALAYLIGAGGVALIGQAILASMRGRTATASTAPSTTATGPTGLDLIAMLLPAVLVLLTIAYVALIPRIGFYLASLAFIPAVLAILGMRRWWVYAVTALGFVAFVHVVFERTFAIPLPRAAWLSGIL